MTAAIGFDLDNTLFDQWSHFGPFCQAAGEWLAASADIDERAATAVLASAWWRYTPASPRLFHLALAELGLNGDLYVPELVTRYRNFRVNLELYDGVRAMLERLSSRWPLFLITDGRSSTQRWKIAELGIEDMFASIVVTHEHGPDWHKPCTRAFLHSAAALGVAPEQCLFVGDNPISDGVGAARCGMRTALVRTGPFRSVQPQIEPDLTVGRTVEIEEEIGRVMHAPLQRWATGQ